MQSDEHTTFTPVSHRTASRRGVEAAAGARGVLAHALLLAGAAAAMFLAAGVPQGSAGIFLVCSGVALSACPPRVRVDGRLWLAAAALVLCASLAFLPAHWFPVPAWRKALEGLPVVPLPVTITPVPWQTAFWVALLAFTALLGLFMLAQPVRSGALQWLTLAAVLICGVYAALAIYARATGWHYPFDGGATFGFFPNRNHTATFLVTGSILAIGILSVTLRDGRLMAAALAAGCLTVCVTGLFFYSASRGGIVFLLAGTLFWIMGLGRPHRHHRLLVSYGAILLAGGTLFLLSRSAAQTRFAALLAHPSPTATGALPAANGAGTNAAPGEMPTDLRVLIYRDALSLIGSYPFTGTGLGTFAMVFPQYRKASLSEFRAVHPESDWLMLVAEAGVPALLCVGALLWLAARGLAPHREHPYWPLRWGCVAAAAAAALHGLVDVPAHHVSLGWWIVALAGLGLQPGRVKAARVCRLQHAAFVLGGIAMLVLGVRLIRAEWFGAEPLPPFAAERMQAAVVLAYDRHDFEAAARTARAAIFASPMEETFYYEWGALELPFADSSEEVDAAFQAERLLNPGPASVPFRQGDAWTHYDSARAAALWLDAFSRRQRLDRVAGLLPATTVDYYRGMLEQAAKWPELQRRLLAAAGDDPERLLVWLESTWPELVPDEIARLSNDGNFLLHLNADERRRFLLAWYTTGDQENLNRFIETHGDWHQAAWSIRLRQWVSAQAFERAVHEASDHYQISLALPNLGEARASPVVPTNEASDPAAAFNAYWTAGNPVAARRVLDQATDQDEHLVPVEAWRLKAAVAAQKGDWASAWQNLRQYIRVSRGETSL